MDETAGSRAAGAPVDVGTTDPSPGSPLLAAGEARTGLLLAAAAAAAVVWASLDPAGYAGAWHHPLPAGIGILRLPSQLQSLVDDGAMVLFFLVVGLELSREMVHGELSDRRVALLPVAAAGGGMVGAALGYLAIAHSGEPAGGVGIPTATDVAFALGALALLGRRVPPSLRLFVLALAVADDLGSLAVLVLGYSARLDVGRLASALACVVAMVVLRHARVGRLLPYLLLGVLCWEALVSSGVEPSLAGVAVGLTIPPGGGNPTALERRVSAVVDPVVLPVFALANAGVAVGSGLLAGAGAGRVFTAMLVARVAGKCLGVTLTTLAVARFTRARLPAGVSTAQLAGAGLVCGVGFTVPLLVAGRAFAHFPQLLSAARVGLLAGSIVAWLGGSAVLLVASRGRPRHR